MTSEHTRHLNTKLRTDALRLGNLSITQRRSWAGMMGHWLESHGSAGIYARIHYHELLLHIFQVSKGYTNQ